MTALAWRQQRAQLGSGAALLALLAALLVWTGHDMTAYMHSSGLSACLAAHQSCDPISQLVEQKYGGLLSDAGWLNFFPMLIGIFWGAPLVARELEQGTHRLAWTQSVTRRRWLATKLGLFALATVAIAVVFGLLMTRWYRPFADVGFHGGFNRMDVNVFDFEGIVPIGYSVYALVLATAAGIATRRVLPAMALTFAGFLPLRLWIQSLRGHFLAPLHATHAYIAPQPQAERGAWIVHQDLLSAAGHRLSTALPSICPLTSRGNKGTVEHCLVAHGIHYVDAFQPASRFWQLQGIEFGIYIVLSLFLAALCFWWLGRRSA